jgi:hypothetical protein
LPPVTPFPVTEPADKNTSPPLPLSPLPTETLTLPPRPFTDPPLTTVTQPLLPDADDPVLRLMTPEAPEDKEFAVASHNEPDPELTLDPLNITTDPPFPDPAASPAVTATLPPTLTAEEVRPALNTIAPPTPLSPLPTTTLTDPP